MKSLEVAARMNSGVGAGPGEGGLGAGVVRGAAGEAMPDPSLEFLSVPGAFSA